MASSSSTDAQQRRATAELPMAKTFWGAEVKPGEPYVHMQPSRGGSLFIRQATIGNNSDMIGWTFLDCKSDNTGHIRLFALNSTNYVSYELNLELKGDVVLSVTGDSSVHVWGYCIHPHATDYGSLDKNTTIHSHLKYDQAGPSKKNGGETSRRPITGETSKRPIIIEDEDSFDDDHLSDAPRRATNKKNKCETSSKAKVLSETMDDITVPVNEPNHSINLNEGDHPTTNVEIQDVTKQNSVATGSGSARSGKVHAHQSPPGDCRLIIKSLKDGRAAGKIASKGSKVTVQYVGKLLDGRIVDAPGVHKFKLGDGSVIVGWERGILGMRVGGKRSLTIPPDLGYGAEGNHDGKIPPNSWLQYEIELTDVKGGPALDLSSVKREN